MNIYDSNRLGRFILRPERSESETGLLDAFRLRTACGAGSMTVIVSSDNCASLVSNIAFELLKIVMSRLCETCVRGRFNSLSDPSASIALFLGLTGLILASFICIRCALVSATIRLRSAASAAFCVYLISRTTLRLAFSCASCSLAVYRSALRRFLFSSASRAFLSLAIAR
jgi:hypothetical protein